MPTPRLVTIQAWSYSRLTTYLQCPRKARYQYVDKLKEPDGAAGLHGTRVHALAAVAATGVLPKPEKDNLAFYPELKALVKAKELPTELSTFAEEFKALKGVKALAEQEWAFDKSWAQVSWFDRRAWLRIKVDLHWLEVTKGERSKRETTVQIMDWKTGKIYPEHAQQRSLYALGAFLIYPDAVAVEAAHGYLDQGHEERERWTGDQLPALKKEWLQRTTALLNDTTFATQPSDKCRWCHFRASNGGPCEVG